MTRRFVPLALLLPLILGAFTTGTDAGASMDASEPRWTVVAEDGPGDAAAADAPVPAPEPRADLRSVAFADDPSWLHVKVTTVASEVPPEARSVSDGVGQPGGALRVVTTTVAFTVERDNGTAGDAYRLVADWDGSFQLYRGTNRLVEVAIKIAPGSESWDFEVALGRSALGSVPLVPGDRLAFIEATTSGTAGARDRAPNVDHGTYTIRTDADGTAIPTWVPTSGVDFAGGPTVATASDGTAHVAYYVYRTEGGTETGIWHATLEEDASGTRTLQAERVGDGTFAAGDDELTRDAQTQIALAIDESDRPHLVYLSAPATADGALRHAMRHNGTWTIGSPNELADGSTVDTTGGHRSVPAVAARDGRVVAAFQSADLDTIAVVERKSDGWHLVRELDDARFPKLALDADGTIRLAFFRETSDQSPNRAVYGDLVYVVERDQWTESVIVKDVEDRSKFWETTATDGSFAFALGPDDRAYFVFETDAEERGFVVWEGGEVSRETTPLTPVHGNIQNRMRMAIDGDGDAHILTGYGGLDLYGMRAANGAWLTQDLQRGDLFTLAVTPDGRAVRASTGAHGGTTLDVAMQSGPATAARAGPADEDQPAPVDWETLPAIGFPLMAFGALGGLALLTGGVRAGADRRPGWFAPGLAAIGGFSRLKKDRLLENKTRDDIVEAVRTNPGVPPATLRRELDVPRSTFFYHLSRLESEGLIRSHRDAGRIWLFVPEAPKAAVAPPVQDALLRATKAEPGRTAAEYAERLGRSRRTILHHLQELERRNAVTRFDINPREVRWGILPDADLEEGG